MMTESGMIIPGFLIMLSAVFGVMMFISPLMIWSHCAKTSAELRKISKQLEELIKWLPDAEESIRKAIEKRP